jgi:hypothetical protein
VPNFKGWNDSGVPRRFAEMFAAHAIDPGRWQVGVSRIVAARRFDSGVLLLSLGSRFVSLQWWLAAPSPRHRLSSSASGVKVEDIEWNNAFKRLTFRGFFAE